MEPGVRVQATKKGNAAAAPKAVRRRSESGEAVRQKIKAIATEMFIRHGYNGVTFLDIGKKLGINHSLVHYHFGTKAQLAEEVLRDFSAVGISDNQAIWAHPEKSLFEKFVEARDRMYRRFLLFNPSGKMQHPTGLVSRFSMDAESLTPQLRALVKDTQEELDQCVEAAVRIAIERGELERDTPVELIVLQISSILFVAGPTARYGWEFNRLDDHFRGALLTILMAFGTTKQLEQAWPPVEQGRKRRDAQAKRTRQTSSADA